MIRFLFRFVGLWLLAGAFVAVVIDGTRSIGASRLVITPLGEAWAALHPASAESLQAAVERNLPPWFWEHVAIYILYAPIWTLLGGIGVLLVVLGRPRSPQVGYSSRD
jgi:hypothetical protein